MAAALALALARGGKKVLLLEVEGRRGSRNCSTPRRCPIRRPRSRWPTTAVSSTPRRSMPSRAAGYLEMFYGIKRGGYALRKLGAIDFATTIAPGLRDVLLTGKASGRSSAAEGGSARLRRCHCWMPRHRPDHPLPSTSTPRSPDWPKVGPIPLAGGPVMGVIRSARTAVPSGDSAGGDAGPGDPGRPAGAGRRDCRWGRHHQPGAVPNSTPRIAMAAPTLPGTTSCGRPRGCSDRADSSDHPRTPRMRPPTAARVERCGGCGAATPRGQRATILS